MCDLGINESKRLESFDYWGFDKPRPVKVGENQGLLSFGVKKCSRCGEVKRFGEFGLEKKVIDGRQAACRECHKKQGREYCQRPEVKARDKERYQRPEVKARTRERENERRATDLNFRIAKNLRRRMNQAIKGGDKVGSAVDDLCCSIEEFKAKVARFFKPGMSWDDNWGNGPGKWHLDHIIPLSAFDLTNREQFLSAAHYSNYQPLWSEENLSKGSRY